MFPCGGFGGFVAIAEIAGRQQAVVLYIKGPLPDPVHECVRCAFGNDASLVEKDNPIGKKFRFFNVVCRQQDGYCRECATYLGDIFLIKIILK